MMHKHSEKFVGEIILPATGNSPRVASKADATMPTSPTHRLVLLQTPPLAYER